MSGDKLESILEAHRKYLAGEDGGRCADLSHANLGFANLKGADLRNANLMGADLRNANLMGANLSFTNLIGANLMDANLRTAVNMDKIFWDNCTEFYPLQCPEEGAFSRCTS